jgi:hypothetical protein
MRGRYHCGDVYPAHPRDYVCVNAAGHEGRHDDGERLWTSEESAARRMLVEEAQAAARERAAHNARLEVLGQCPPRGGLVGNRAQRRAGLRRR